MKKILLAFALLVVCLSLSACSFIKGLGDGVIILPWYDETAAPETTEPETPDTTEPDTSAPETSTPETPDTTEPDSSAPHVHTPEPVAGVPTSCTKTGLTDGVKCAECGEILTEQLEVPMLPHVEAEIPAVPATCTKKGLSAGKKCSVCDTVLTAQTETDMIPHTYTDGKCTVCGALRVSQGLEMRETKDGKGYEVIGKGTCEDTVLIIPSTYNGKPVVEIGSAAFMGQDNLSAVYLPEGLVTVDDMAFRGCSGLKTVSIPKTLKNIGMSAFKGATSLTKFIYNGTLTEWTALTTAAGKGWNEDMNKFAVGPEKGDVILCSHNQEAVIGEPATCSKEGFTSGIKCTICGKVISGMTPIPKLSHEFGADKICRLCGESSTPHTHVAVAVPAVPATCTSVGYKQGTKCGICDQVMTAQEVIPMIAHSIVGGKCAVCGYKESGSDGISYVFIAETQTYAVTGRGTATDSVISIANSINGFPVTMIVAHAFLEQDITGIMIPENVTLIGESAFEKCTKLQTVSLPSTLTTIGEGAFANCTALVNLTVHEKNTTFYSEANCLIRRDSEDTKTLLYGNSTGRIPMGVTHIGQRSFMNMTALTSLTIPTSVRRIEANAFENCTALMTVNYTGTEAQWNNINKYGWDVELGNYTLNVIEGGVKYSLKKERLDYVLGATGYTVAGSDHLPTDAKKVEVPATYKGVAVVSVSNFAFNDKLTDITIPASVTAIGLGSFRAESFTVRYGGTKAAWKAAIGETAWTESTDYTIICSDGTLTHSDLTAGK